MHFEAYVSGLGAPLVGGGRYDQMLARFGYDCPATGFAFEVGRALLALESQGAGPALAGPDFFIIDFTPDKTRALALARRYRDLGAAVARDIIIRGLDDSLAYARQQRARWVLVIGGPERQPDEVRVLDLQARRASGSSSVGRASSPIRSAISRISGAVVMPNIVSSARSGATRPRASWWTCSRRTWTRWCAIRAATTPATP